MSDQAKYIFDESKPWIHAKEAQIQKPVYVVPQKTKRGIRHIRIGDHTIIQVGSTLYGGISIGTLGRIGHSTVIRPDTHIGDHSSIGNLVMIEGNTTIGDHTIVNSQCHITAHAEIGNYVFFGACVNMTNDLHMLWNRKGHGKKLKGPVIEDFVRIGNNVTILPGITIESHAVIGAGAVVTKDVPSGEIWAGVPAKKIGEVKDPMGDFVGCRICSPKEWGTETYPD